MPTISSGWTGRINRWTKLNSCFHFFAWNALPILMLFYLVIFVSVHFVAASEPLSIVWHNINQYSAMYKKRLCHFRFVKIALAWNFKCKNIVYRSENTSCCMHSLKSNTKWLNARSIIINVVIYYLATSHSRIYYEIVRKSIK